MFLNDDPLVNVELFLREQLGNVKNRILKGGEKPQDFKLSGFNQTRG